MVSFMGWKLRVPVRYMFVLLGLGLALALTKKWFPETELPSLPKSLWGPHICIMITESSAAISLDAACSCIDKINNTVLQRCTWYKPILKISVHEHFESEIFISFYIRRARARCVRNDISPELRKS